MNRLYMIVAGTVAAFALIFVLQNTEVASIRFLIWDLTMSRVLFLLLTMLAGFLLGFVVARVTARK